MVFLIDPLATAAQLPASFALHPSRDGKILLVTSGNCELFTDLFGPVCQGLPFLEGERCLRARGVGGAAEEETPMKNDTKNEKRRQVGSGVAGGRPAGRDDDGKAASHGTAGEQLKRLEAMAQNEELPRELAELRRREKLFEPSESLPHSTVEDPGRPRRH